MASNANGSSADLKLSVDGLAQYKQDLNQAKATLKLMSAEVKAATTALDANSDSQNTNSQKAELLKGKLNAQKDVVTQLSSIVAACTLKYGEASPETRKWRTQLALAETNCSNTQIKINQLTAAETTNVTKTSDAA